MRYLVIFKYDGSLFHGFQRQKNVVNVQGTLEESLSKILNTKIVIKGSGRTDAGVHATGQTAHFDYNKIITKKDIKLINKYLDNKIFIKKIKHVNNDFHARFSVKSKTYLYKINIGKYDESKENYFYQVKYKFDKSKLKEVCRLFEGTHDFHNFVSGYRDNYVSTIFKVRVIRLFNTIYIVFKGKGFYRYMVRHLVGALIDVGIGKTSIDIVKDMLNNPDKHKELRVVPPEGLYLVKIKY